MALSAGAAEYTDCISTDRKDYPNEYPVYDIKQSDGNSPVKMELWKMRSTPLLPWLPGTLWARVEAIHKKERSRTDWIEQFSHLPGCKQKKNCTSAKLNCLKENKNSFANK